MLLMMPKHDAGRECMDQTRTRTRTRALVSHPLASPVELVVPLGQVVPLDQVGIATRNLKNHGRVSQSVYVLAVGIVFERLGLVEVLLDFE